jgi:alpha-galactosidase
MGDALEATGRPIVYSLCEYGLGSVERWGPAVGGNLWRTTGDISDEWQMCRRTECCCSKSAQSRVKHSDNNNQI